MEDIGGGRPARKDLKERVDRASTTRQGGEDRLGFGRPANDRRKA